VTPEDATAVRNATLTAHVHARHVYLVLGGDGTVSVNGRPIRVTHPAPLHRSPTTPVTASTCCG
jgi:hypothetical protein